jgi:hypothetical protein
MIPYTVFVFVILGVLLGMMYLTTWIAGRICPKDPDYPDKEQ